MNDICKPDLTKDNLALAKVIANDYGSYSVNDCLWALWILNYYKHDLLANRLKSAIYD